MSRSSTRWWERRAAGLENDDERLHGTVTEQVSVVKLRDRLEKAHIARVVPIRNDARVLDLGGGAGRMALWFAERAGEVILVDASESHLEIARRHAAKRGLGNVRTVCSLAEDYALGSRRYDIIVIAGLLTHLSDDAIRALGARIARALAPGGRLVLKEPVTTDGEARVDRRYEAGEIVYEATFRPRERYVELLADHLPLLYQSATLAHPIPFVFQGTNEAAEQTDGASPLIYLIAPIWERLDPWMQEIEGAVRSSPRLAPLLAPVPVLQDLYVFGAPRVTPEDAPDLSVVVIAYNEEECLEDVVDELSGHLESEAIVFELVLVDDGSSDGTLAIMELLAASDPRLRVVPLTPNRGIGGALRAGFDAAAGEHVTWVPADGQIAPESVAELFVRRHEAPMLTTVYTSRDDAFYRHVISQTLNVFIRLRSGEVAKSGGNYLFSRAAWERYAPRDDDSMMISTAFRKNLRDADVPIVEVGISARARVAGKSKVLNARTILRTLASAARIGRKP